MRWEDGRRSAKQAAAASGEGIGVGAGEEEEAASREGLGREGKRCAEESGKRSARAREGEEGGARRREVGGGWEGGRGRRRALRGGGAGGGGGGGGGCGGGMTAADARGWCGDGERLGGDGARSSSGSGQQGRLFGLGPCGAVSGRALAPCDRVVWRG